MSNWQPPGYGQPPQGAPPPGYPPPQQGPYVPPGAPQQGAPPGYGAPPPQYGQPPPQGAPPPGYPPQGAPPPQQGPYAPPGAAPPGYGQPPPGYPPQGAPQGYGQPPGYPPQGAPQGQSYGAPAPAAPFRPVIPNLDNDRDPILPAGSSLFVCTGQVAIVADGKLLQVECFCEQSNNQQSVGQKGFWKCWLERPSIRGNGGAQAASNDIAKFLCVLTGRDPKQTDPNTLVQLIGEFVARQTVEGRPIQGMRFAADVVHKLSKQQNLFAQCVYHVAR